jgi:hypothetical protein
MGVQKHDWFPLVPHGDTVRHSVHYVLVCMLSGFPTVFTSDNSSVNLQVKALLVHVIFLDVLLFVGLLANNLLLHNPPQSSSM